MLIRIVFILIFLVASVNVHSQNATKKEAADSSITEEQIMKERASTAKKSRQRRTEVMQQKQKELRDKRVPPAKRKTEKATTHFKKDKD